MKRFVMLLLVMSLLVTMVGCSGLALIPDVKGKTVSRGTIEGDVYTSEFIGVSFTRPKTWVYATDEEIANAMQIGAELMNKENFGAQAEKMNNVYDMMASDLMSGDNINIVFENLKASNSSNITEEQYIEVAKNMLKEQAAMFNYVIGDAEKCKLGQQEFYRLPMEGNYLGAAFKQFMYIRKEGTYMVVITLSLFSDKEPAEYEAMFK